MASPGNPQPKFEWFLDGKPVSEGLYIETRIHDVTEREFHGCLQLDNPTHVNNGRYTLVASNVYGTDQKEVEAHFMHKPWEGEVCFSARAIFSSSMSVGFRRHAVIECFMTTQAAPVSG